MSEKAKKSASDVSYGLSKWFSKVSTMRPSNMIMALAVLITAVLLFSGIVYDIVQRPLPAVYYGNRFYFLYPSVSEQFIFDTVVSGFMYLLGFVGLYAVYTSSRHSSNPRSAYMVMIVGATLVLIAYLLLEYFIRIKISGA